MECTPCCMYRAHLSRRRLVTSEAELGLVVGGRNCWEEIITRANGSWKLRQSGRVLIEEIIYGEIFAPSIALDTFVCRTNVRKCERQSQTKISLPLSFSMESDKDLWRTTKISGDDKDMEF